MLASCTPQPPSSHVSESRSSVTGETGPARWLTLFLLGVASVTLFLLMAITCVDVVGRYFFNSPLTGSTELTEFAMAILIFTTLPVVSWRNQHVVVDLLDRWFSGTAARVRTVVIHIISAVSLGYLGQRIQVLGNRSLSYGELSEYLHFPPGYIMLYMAGMCWFTAALLITYGIYRVLSNKGYPS